MKKIKILVFVLIVCLSSPMTAQVNTETKEATKLVKLILANSLSDINSEETLQKKDEKRMDMTTLLKDLTKQVENTFDSVEIKRLLDFYQSAVGEKLLKSNLINTMNSTLLNAKKKYEADITKLHNSEMQRLAENSQNTIQMLNVERQRVNQEFPTDNHTVELVREDAQINEQTLPAKKIKEN